MLSGLKVRPKVLVFFDKNGSPRFRPIAAAGESSFDETGVDGQAVPFEKAVSLLVSDCMERGQLPANFSIILATGEGFVGGLIFEEAAPAAPRAPLAKSPELTRRQQQVLACVSQSLSNKEIGAKLGISERTAKFHVASLLKKFQVENRVRLMFDTAPGGEAGCRECPHQDSSGGARASYARDARWQGSGRWLQPLRGARMDVALLEEFRGAERSVVNAPRQRDAHEQPRKQHNQSR